MNKPAKLIVAAAGTIALAGGIGAGLAYADSPSTPPSGSPSATPSSGPSSKAGPGKQRQPRKLIARSIHGEVTLAGKRHRVIAFQRGTVEAIDAKSLTVESPDGFRATYVISDQTKVRQGKEPGKVTDLTADDRVRVVAVKDGSRLTAKMVRERVK